MKGDIIMSDLKKYINKQMQDDEFCREYEKTRQAVAFQREMIRARIEKQMTQKQLAEKIGFRQSNISRIENGSVIPNVSTLMEIAKGLDMRLEIHFVNEE